MIKVLYDHQMFSLQKYGGISRYFANLFYSFQKSADVEVEAPVLYSGNQYLKNETSLLPGFLGNLLAAKKSRMYKWNKQYSKYQLKTAAYDLFHPTYYDAYFLKDLRKPYVITVHDMIYELYPQYFDTADKFVMQKETVIRNANHIIAISESTKRDLQRFYNIADDKISVIHHGFYPETTSVKPAGFELNNYLLFVGDRANYKNFQLFAEAVAPLLQQNDLLRIVCTGGGSFTTAETVFFAGQGIVDKVLQINATNEELNYLYKHASVFVYPSLYEGFGFPILEAFANNCVVACSNTSSFPEVGGDAVAYFDPFSKEEMFTVIASLLSNTLLAEQLKEKGKQRLSLFKMEKCVAATADVYHKLLKT
ncbi:glycosyltransferase family 1 protein [Lacibacter luteus]|uniref:Glycosyltransferase family 1 protein n=1 Tax=Lacibacter luteus TaxID=2508719 RepID=A0A4V1M7I7_9BACT|nr:glycosyltransferase family 1 protein [Lacibacter luteus]RXK60012.1 glycosyltransferase family 1 protein [Lacibacter luteus]